MSVIYFARSGSYVKVGWTSLDPAARIDALQVGNPVAIELLGTLTADRAGEARIHQALLPAWVRGEWFDGSHPSVVHVLGLIGSSEFWDVVDGLAGQSAKSRRLISEACPIPGAQQLLAYIRERHGSIPAFCERHSLDRFKVARAINGEILKIDVDFAVAVQLATDGAVPAKSWRTDEGMCAAIKQFRSERAARKAA